MAAHQSESYGGRTRREFEDILGFPTPSLDAANGFAPDRPIALVDFGLIRQPLAYPRGEEGGGAKFNNHHVLRV